MKILWVRAKGYKGIYQGTGLKEIYIDFRKCKNKIIMIFARNGGGKSTLLDLLGPYADASSCFIDKESGSKEIAYLHKGLTYIINYEHPVTTNGDRAQTRAYIKKQSENGMIEYNPSGNITTSKDFLDAEFGLDPNFVALSKMSTEDKGLVDKSPAERKRFINSIIQSVEVYNNINKTLSKRSSSYKSLMNNIISKIDSIGEEDNLNFTLKSIENRLSEYKTRRDIIYKNISEAEAMIKVLDPDLSIQTLYTSIQVELESLNFQIEQYDKNISYLTDKGLNNVLDAEQCAQLYATNANNILKYQNLIEKFQSSINDMLISREEESRSIQLKVQRLNSLKSEFNFADIQKSIGMHEANITEYEKFFNDINIKNAIAISKDEYVSGLHTLKDIKDMVDGFKSYSSSQTILDSVDYIRSNTNMVQIQSSNSNKLDKALDYLESLTNQLYYYNGLLSKLDILNNRPENCSIDSCAFIKDSLDALQQNPKEKILEIEKQIKECNDDIRVLETNNNKILECMSCINNINIILRNIKNNTNILNKLPNGYIFSDQDEFLNRLYRGDNFEDIDKLYKYIGYANIFEEYKTTKDVLYKLKTDYKIYESKNEIIEELSNDILDINSKLDNITYKLEETNSTILKYNQEISNLTDIQEKLDTMISIFRKRSDIEIKKSDNISKLNAISSNMQKISLYINTIESGNVELANLDSQIIPLEQDREKIRYGLVMLADYNRELESFTKSYNLIDILKTYSSPTKKGIQNLFIKVYMSNTLNLANELLSHLFDGRMKLLPYNIGENGEFSIPCISMHTGMKTDDISSCSRSEKSMISMILGFVLLKQSSTDYNILRLDEIDEGLDSSNRLMFTGTLGELQHILEVEQCIMVSHSPEHTGEMDIIQLEQTDSSTTVISGNIIFSL